MTDEGGRKARAKAAFRGIETILMPSFTPDLSALDEEGIRHDVRMSKRHGFFSVFVAPVGLTADEQLRMIEIAVDEAGGELLVSLIPEVPGDEAKIDLLRRAADAGAAHALIHPPFDWRPADEQALYEWYRKMIDAAPLDAVLWATDGANFRHFAAANVPVTVIDRLADLDRVVAIKLMTTLDETIVFDLCERVADRMLIGCVNLRLFPLLAKHYGAQWSGAWTAEALQSPDAPCVTDYVRQLAGGDFDAALATYRRIMPAYQALFALMAPVLPKGVHPFTQLKYYQWYVGGNGGLMRPPHDPNERAFPLTPAQREQVAAAYAAIGIEGGGPLESFIVGRALHESGTTPAHFAPAARSMIVETAS
ncbi:MAG: dihydrodipicolinate synthase family protein [Allosphingosinicella sp.]